MNDTQKLWTVYKELKLTKLVKDGDTSKESLEEFENLLNSAIPENSEYRELMRCMYLNNKRAFNDVLNGYGSVRGKRGNRRFFLRPLVLWTEPRNIKAEYGIPYEVMFLTSENGKHLIYKKDEVLANRNSKSNERFDFKDTTEQDLEWN